VGSGGGLFDAYAYRGAGDGWGYRGLGLLANPWQEPFGRATLKAAISAIVAGAVLGSYPFIAWVTGTCGEQMPVQCSRNRLTADRFERKAVSQIRVATKTIVPVVKFQDFLSNGGVYEEAGWIAST
jgi:hypothetical protein